MLRPPQMFSGPSVFPPGSERVSPFGRLPAGKQDDPEVQREVVPACRAVERWSTSEKRMERRARVERHERGRQRFRQSALDYPNLLFDLNERRALSSVRIVLNRRQSNKKNFCVRSLFY